jgi:mono/diheme cytochrome c family protein
MRGARVLILLVLISGLFAGLASAGQPTIGSKGNETKGRYFFRQTCKTCHSKGSVGGEITPLNKTMAQWRSYFAAGRHNHSKEPLEKVMEDAQLHDVSTFLVAHAADSLQPETCGSK